VGGELALRSRNGVDMAGWFPELGGLAGALGDHVGVLDGEVVAFDADGWPSFEALQQRMASRVGRRRGAAVAYLVSDLLWLDGRLLTGLPYVERRRLEELEVAGPAWQTVASFPGTGTALLAATREQGLEGVVAKRLQSTYVPGRRTRNWLKTKHYQRETFLSAASFPTATRSGRCWSASPARSRRPAPGCWSAPRWPSRSASSAGSRAGYGTLPTAA
jgi:bifunctional non-homologous end joining protein LigD